MQQLSLARSALLLVVLTSLAGAAWAGPDEPSQRESVSVAASPANVLKPNDVILVKVYQEDDLETRTAIDRDGLVTLPLLGAVWVGNKTPEQATALIQELYGRDYLVNPRVSLTLIEHAKRRLTVMGQVQRPGTYEFPADQPLNLLQAIAMAGGYTRLAAPAHISLQRLQNGQPVLYPLNAEQMSRDKKAKPFAVMPDDIITVGERIF